MSTFWRELLDGVRQVQRRPGFTLVIGLTIALGIGATTAVFSVADWVLFRPLPGTSNFDRVVTAELRNREGRAAALSVLNFHDIRTSVSALSRAAAWQIQLLQLMGENQRSVQVFGEIVAGDYFEMLGLRPRLGRALSSDETLPGRSAMVAVISHDLWQSMFSGDPAVIGKVMRVNRHELTIVGVAPAGFRGAERTGRIDVWVPSSIAAVLRHMPTATALDARRSIVFLNWGGRLAQGATAAGLETQLRQIVPRLVQQYPEDNSGLSDVTPVVYQGVGLSQTASENLRATVRILFIAVTLLLLIACANVANMLLFRGAERRGEAAIRRSLGATGRRLIRQQIAESLVVSLAGGMLGLVVALIIQRIFEGTRLELIELRNVPLDMRVLAFAMVVSIGTGLLFGLVPTLLTGGRDLASMLQQAGLRQTGRKSWVRSATSVLQLSLSLALLVGAVQLTRTLFNYYAIDTGFDESALSVTLDMQPQGYSPERRRAFETSLLERLQSAPEFESAALTVNTPFAGFYASARILHPASGDTVTATAEWVSPGYFETLRSRIISGRPIGAEDLNAGTGVRNVVVSEALAQRLFGSANPLAQVFSLAGRMPGQLHVVGVAADKYIRSLQTAPEPVLYEAHDASSRFAQYIMVVVRSPLPARETEAVLRGIVDGLDPALPFMYVERLSEKTARVAMSEQRLFARLLVTLAALAVLMAAVGLYAVIAYSVTARRREIGIRMALGADRHRVLRMILREAASLATPGVVLGIAGAVALSRLIESRLFGVAANDLFAYTAAAILLVLVAGIAAALPARSATRVDPLIALRQE